jgi:ppGpp synthetase/RelA/SpoT-type nucleotidyltranferase
MRFREEEIEEKLHFAQLEAIGDRLEEDITHIIDRTGIYFRIFYRVKTPASIVKKLGKDGYGFGDGDKKLQDLIGLRVVVYYHDDMPIVRTILDETFRRVGEWSQTGTTEEEFKATKQNGVFRVPNEYQRTYVGDFDGIPADFTFEVQLRTISFEGWHEIEHDMRYKSTHGEAFWRNNEDLSRTLNCVLANLELCDWSTVSVFDKLSYYHFKEGNWEMMIKGKYRLRFDEEPLAPELVEFLNANPEVAYCLYRCNRDQIIFPLLRDGYHEKITYNLVLKVANDSVADYDGRTKRKLTKLCREVMKEEKTVRPERPELKPLDVTPSFRLHVVLSHNPDMELEQEFRTAVQVIAGWAQSQFCNITDGIPTEPVDYELHEAGYNLKILGNVSLGFYKMSMDFLDTNRKGVVWRTKVSLEMGERIRMNVDCDYCHRSNRMVRDSFSKPRFVDEIFRRIGYEDVIPMSLKVGRIRTMNEVENLSSFIADHRRSLPVILAVEEEDKERQINIARLAETVGTYAHVFLIEKAAIPLLVEISDYTKEELFGAVWVTFPGGEDKFYTRDMIANSRFDFNKYAFDEGNVYEKAFRHKLVRLIKEQNC